VLLEFEDIKGVIRIRNLKKNRQHNGQKKKVQKDKQRSTKHIYKTKDRLTRTPLKTGGELRCSGKVSSSCSTNQTLLRHDPGQVHNRRKDQTTQIFGKRHCALEGLIYPVQLILPLVTSYIQRQLRYHKSMLTHLCNTLRRSTI
jgi:hypothetical protein